MSAKGTLFIISAPSGAGKTSLVHALTHSLNDITVSISHTTRPMRPGEVDGVDYHFVDEAAFAECVAQDKFLEHATVFENSYGTSSEWVSQQLDQGMDVILEIDWQGAEKIQQRVKDSVDIFILPPSLDALKMRLNRRAQDSADVIDSRMAQARDEMSHFAEYDYVVINDEFSTALADLQAIVRAQRLKMGKQRVKYRELLTSMVG